MTGALNTFATNSRTWWANRRADGIRPIDQAIAVVQANWQLNNGFSAQNDACVGNLLSACARWLAHRRVLGLRVTGWREEPIRELYWQVAWCYSCDNYVQQALQQIGNIGNNPITLTDPVNPGSVEGNPYAYNNSGFTHAAMAQPPRILRGDTRGPDDIDQAHGFLPINTGRWAYDPWFAGSASGTTPSVTTQEDLAIEAGPAARAKKWPVGNSPAWLAGIIQNLTQANPPVYAFVYEFGQLGNALSARVTATQVGKEHVFLAIPAACITNWWAVLPNRHTVGPFPFPAGAVAPAGGFGLSGAPKQLA